MSLRTDAGEWGLIPYLLYFRSLILLSSSFLREYYNIIPEEIHHSIISTLSCSSRSNLCQNVRKLVSSSPPLPTILPPSSSVPSLVSSFIVSVFLIFCRILSSKQNENYETLLDKNITPLLPPLQKVFLICPEIILFPSEQYFSFHDKNTENIPDSSFLGIFFGVSFFLLNLWSLSHMLDGGMFKAEFFNCIRQLISMARHVRG